MTIAFTAGFGAALVATFGVAALGVALGVAACGCLRCGLGCGGLGFCAFRRLRCGSIERLGTVIFLRLEGVAIGELT